MIFACYCTKYLTFTHELLSCIGGLKEVVRRACFYLLTTEAQA